MTRYRLEQGEGVERYPVMAEFRAEGATDYLVFVMPFLADGVVNPLPTGAVVTLATDRPGGFSEADVAAAVELMPGFGGAVRIGSNLSAIRTALDTYLGRDVGRRILNGEIRRGSVETISAAIVFGDLRGFTALSDEIPREQLIAMLDDYLGMPGDTDRGPGRPGAEVPGRRAAGDLCAWRFGSEPALRRRAGRGGRGSGAHRESE